MQNKTQVKRRLSKDLESSRFENSKRKQAPGQAFDEVKQNNTIFPNGKKFQIWKHNPHVVKPLQPG